MAGVVCTILKPEFGLFRYSMAVGTVCYLIFSCGRPDVLVARYNTAHLRENISSEDLEYLADLSMDTAPILSRYNFKHENCENNQGEYVEEYDYYIQEEVWSFYDEREETDTDHRCRRCLLNQKFHEVLEETENMDVRTINISKYMARKAAKESIEK
jgi:hypothetical protein